MSDCFRRSLLATIIFFTSAAVTVAVMHTGSLPVVSSPNWTIESSTSNLLLLQILPLALELALFSYVSAFSPLHQHTCTNCLQSWVSSTKNLTSWRPFVSFLTALHFSLALHVTALNDAQRVLSFLALPRFGAAYFDPTLAFLALGTLPLSAILYRISVRLSRSPGAAVISSKAVNGHPRSNVGKSKPFMGGEWSIPENSWSITPSLIVGAVLFGIGWGLEGLCPGPAILNVGRALVEASVSPSYAQSDSLSRLALWFVGFFIGGHIVS